MPPACCGVFMFCSIGLNRSSLRLQPFDGALQGVDEEIFVSCIQLKRGIGGTDQAMA